MIVSFRCPTKLKEQIDGYIAADLYPDFSTFCVTALENQILLEESHRKTAGQPASDSAERGFSERISSNDLSEKGKKHRNSPAAASRIQIPSYPPSPGTPPTEIQRARLVESNRPETIAAPSIPLDLNLARLDGKPPFSLPSLFADVFERDHIVPIDRWLFGQYNRLLPAKVSIRALAVISHEGKDSLTLESVAPRIAQVAAELGDYLRSLDRRFANHRDDALATAFPEGNLEGQKGRLRYQNHFVGHTVKGEQGGMLVGLKLAQIHVFKNKPHILPTTAGWDFARLSNPILDSAIDQNAAKLSEEEIIFLLRHIKDHVPTELFAYHVILSSICDGKNTPELLNQDLAKFLSPGKRLDDEQDFLTTQRNGVFGRMTDLGLVSRDRQGTRITYRLTPDGKNFLDDVGKIPSRNDKEGIHV